ncbi:hypothetical protein [Aliikangiella maris]|uniref:Uncharacterized protein n=2 Tax=Aliikangiella maris TaxID=3162458 RepID=A0ABV3MLK7_9GAMM
MIDANNWQITHLPEKTSLRASAIGFDTIWVGGTEGKVFISHDQGKNFITSQLRQNLAAFLNRRLLHYQ